MWLIRTALDVQLTHSNLMRTCSQKKRRADALEVLLKPLREEEAEKALEAKQNELALKRKIEQDRREAAWSKLSPAERVKAQKKEEDEGATPVDSDKVRLLSVCLALAQRVTLADSPTPAGSSAFDPCLAHALEPNQGPRYAPGNRQPAQ